MKILCTAPGKFGDLLWSLATVKELYYYHFDAEPVEGSTPTIGDGFYASEIRKLIRPELDLGIMPQYESLLPLLNAQSYINKAFVIKEWICTGSPAGDQPWQSPDFEGREQYDKVIDLGYRHHPGKDEPLIDFIARQQGIVLQDPIPFISTPWFCPPTFTKPVIAYTFNESMIDLKQKQLDYFKSQLEQEITFVDISKMGWLEAATLLSSVACIAFIGCRSSNYVLASGLGKRVFIYEPNFARSKYGPWGTTFTNPYGKEEEIANADSTIEEIKMLKKEVIN